MWGFCGLRGRWKDGIVPAETKAAQKNRLINQKAEMTEKTNISLLLKRTKTNHFISLPFKKSKSSALDKTKEQKNSKKTGRDDIEEDRFGVTKIFDMRFAFTVQPIPELRKSFFRLSTSRRIRGHLGILSSHLRHV